MTFETEALSDHTLSCIEQSHLLQKTVSGLLVPLGGGTTSYHNNVLLKHQGQSKHGLDSLNSTYSLNDSKASSFEIQWISEPQSFVSRRKVQNHVKHISNTDEKKKLEKLLEEEK